MDYPGKQKRREMMLALKNLLQCGSEKQNKPKETVLQKSHGIENIIEKFETVSLFWKKLNARQKAGVFLRAKGGK